MTRRAALTLALLAAAWPSTSAAVEPWTSDGGKSALEVRAFYKSLATVLRLPGGLVDITGRLATLAEAAGLPAIASLPRAGASSAHTVRLWGNLLLRERLELQAGWQLGAQIASDRALGGAAALGAGVPAGGAQAARRRLVDLDPVLADEGGFRLEHDLDLLAVKLRSSFADLTVGRQVLSWGAGRLWNPTDLLSPFAPTDVDREVRRGIDAVRVSIPLAATAQLELLWLPQPQARDQGAVARAQLNLAGFDLAPSAAKYVRDLVLGLEASGDLGPLGVHAEVAWTRGLDLDAGGERDQFVRAVAGLDWRPAGDLAVTGELYFNGWGAADAPGYLAVLRSPRVTRGEVFGAGRYYLGVVAAWRPSELVTLQAIAVANLGDPSLLLVPALEYWAEQSVLVRVGGYLPLGRAPDTGVARGLTPDDAAMRTAAWDRAVTTLGLRSEYGASPLALFVQLAIYVL